MTRLLIVQPYVPTYRVAFFDALVTRLRSDDIDCIVAAPMPSGAQALRGDATLGHTWHRSTTGGSVSLAGVTFRRYGAIQQMAGADAVIAPLIGTALDTHAAATMRLGRRRVGLWGHVGAYVREANPVDVAVENVLMRASHHVFAYTPRGARSALARGVDATRITTLMNTIDTASLSREIRELDDAAVHKFSATHALHPGKTLAYLGGLDASKRIELLSAALDLLWEMDPQIKLVVGGTGRDVVLIEPAARRGQVALLGYADDHLKALISATSHALINPGRTGLLAVDAMTMGLPVVTTAGALHGPEIDYLRDGRSLIEAAATPSGLAEAMVAVLEQQPRPVPPPPPMLETMVDNFTRGVHAMLG